MYLSAVCDCMLNCSLLWPMQGPSIQLVFNKDEGALKTLVDRDEVRFGVKVSCRGRFLVR